MKRTTHDLTTARSADAQWLYASAERFRRDVVMQPTDERDAIVAEIANILQDGLSNVESFARYEAAIRRHAPPRSGYQSQLERALRIRVDPDLGGDHRLNNRERARDAREILAALAKDIQLGYVRSPAMPDRIRLELLTDQLLLAEQFLEDRVPHAAAVTAGVVLEQHVRRLAQTWEVDTHAKDGRWLGFQDLSQRLSKAGAYSGTVHAEAVSWYKIRTVGAHEPPDRSDPAQVRRMLHGVRDFVASHPA